MSLLLSGDLKLSKPTTSSVLITPQTKVPVDPLIGNVSLLLHGDGTNGKQNNTFLDSSTNNFTITRNGNTTQGSFSPFGKVGGSGYFDGTSDYLVIAPNNAFNFGSGDWTIEAWMFDVGTTIAAAVIVGATNYGTATNVQIFYDGSTRKLNYYGPTGSLITSTATISRNTWNHVAAVRLGTTVTLYVNGTTSGTVVDSASIPSTINMTVGSAANDNVNSRFFGYISNLRILKGTALYTANFTPPTSPLTAITNTSLLLNFTNAGIVDSAARNNLETVGNAQVSTAQSKFGGSSIYLDGTGDYLTIPDSNNFNFGSGNFTIEAWVRFSVSTSGVTYFIASQADNSYVTNCSWSFVRHETNKLRFISTSDGGFTGVVIVNSVNDFLPQINTWYHLAAVRLAGTVKLYLDGVEVGSGANSTTFFDSTRVVGIGASSTGEGAITGYIEDLRITKNIARYTANFTPPTAPFGDI